MLCYARWPPPVAFTEEKDILRVKTVSYTHLVEEFSTFVDPGRKLEERITELTGIRDEDLADAPQLDEVFPRCV